MRLLIYVLVISNVVLGFWLLFRETSPFRGKTYRDLAKERRKGD